METSIEDPDRFSLPDVTGAPTSGTARAPVHVVYGGAHLFSSRTFSKLQKIALDGLAQEPPGFAARLGVLALSDEELVRRVKTKLETEPFEDYRIDFEDGLGPRSDSEEDELAVRAAQSLASADLEVPSVGLRVRALSGPTGRRAVRTLDLFLTGLARAGWSRPLVVTLPKVRGADEVAKLAELVETLETKLGLPPIAIEVMVETTELLEGGGAALTAVAERAGPRLVAAHLGTYDLTAACGVAARHQTPEHLLADAARSLMKFNLARFPVRLSDGATTELPVPIHRHPATDQETSENRAAITRALRLHADLIRRSMSLGFYQGWDLHPAQLIARYAAVYDFFNRDLAHSVLRLRTFLSGAAKAVRTGQSFDDAATGLGLLGYLRQCVSSGACLEGEIADRLGVPSNALSNGTLESLAGFFADAAPSQLPR